MAPKATDGLSSTSLKIADGVLEVRGRLANVDAAAIVLGRADRPFAPVDEVWRRAGVPAASLVKIAEADGFRAAMGLARREALWAIKALRDEPLPPLRRRLSTGAGDRAGVR